MLAELATRAGYSVVSLDYFGDSDLRLLCPGISLLRDRNMGYTPEILVKAASELHAPSVVYGASLENHPHHVARLARNRTLLGNDPGTLERVRDPHRLAAMLRSAGFCFPQTTVPGVEPLPDPGKAWLWKPLRSGGGHSVQTWSGQSFAREGVLQERLDGMPGSAAFVANGQEGIVVGLTRQLIGDERFGAGGFRYCGNILPPPLPRDELRSLLVQVRAIVNLLTTEFGLVGLNGLDFIWHNDRIWTLEVNPRPPASLELIDTAYDIRVFEAHVHSFEGKLPDFELETVISGQAAAGKAILFATQDVTVGDTGHWLACGIRDIPHVDEQIQQHHPICTIVTTSATAAGCLEILETQAANIQSWLKRKVRYA
jgi:predicted ATP-grasp superfamily ATP-dependent carboligase